MEIQSGNGSKTRLEPGTITQFGRGSGFNDGNDRTVSRRQILFNLNSPTDSNGDDTRVGFEVVGKNPVWVHSSKTGELKTYRSSDRGEMEDGDMFCVSANKPVWFALKRFDFCHRSEMGAIGDSLERLDDDGVEELELDSIDLSEIDPVKEFGFVVMGHEFEGYPKKMIRDIKNWDWYIEDLREESECDEGRRRKRKKVGKNDNDDDEEWTGESEEEKEVIIKPKKSQRPKYVTRSKGSDKPSKNTGKGKLSVQKKSTCDEESDDDETLGGFIVEDEELEEEEEEFDEDEFEDDLEDE